MNNPELKDISLIESAESRAVNNRPFVQRLMDNWEGITWAISGSLILGGIGITGGPTWPIYSNPELGLAMMAGGVASIGMVYSIRELGKAYIGFLKDHHGHR